MPQELAIIAPEIASDRSRILLSCNLGGNMRTLALAAAALVFMGSAYAADRPLTAAPLNAPPLMPPPFNWGGWYIGVNAGAGWTRESFATLPQATLATSPFDNSLQWGTSLSGSSKTGFTGGGQVGYNWPSTGPVVVGVEADIEAFGGKASNNSTFLTVLPPPPIVTVNNSVSSKTPWVATLRGRVGTTSIVNPAVLVYATAGLAMGQQDVTGVISTFGATPIESFPFSISDTRFGWTAGAGVEWFLNNNWSVGAEWLYINLTSNGQTSLTSLLGPGARATDAMSLTPSSETLNIVRARVNYKF
jgi:outer membrane immunogenic protein